jgi:hypothetical protein
VKKNPRAKASNELCMELKYCERCGRLWLRSSLTAEVYCENCLPVVDELPAPRLTRTSPQLPVGPRSLVDEEIDFCDIDDLDLRSAGGAA